MIIGLGAQDKTPIILHETREMWPIRPDTILDDNHLEQRVLVALIDEKAFPGLAFTVILSEYILL